MVGGVGGCYSNTHNTILLIQQKKKPYIPFITALHVLTVFAIVLCYVKDASQRSSMHSMHNSFRKLRKHFGCDVRFSDKNEVLFTQHSTREYAAEYVLKNPITKDCQCAPQTARSVANTVRATYKHTGITHYEGGWPKDVTMEDPEQTVRYRRKMEKDEKYITQVTHLAKSMEHYIYQNNAVNIYENYFDGMEDAPLPQSCYSRTVNVYRDPNPVKVPLQHISWSPDGAVKMAVSHCDMKFQNNHRGQLTHSYIWELENPNTPYLVLEPKVPCVCIEYNQKDPTSLVSGMYNGQVATFDTRHGKKPVLLSERECCHQEPVNSVLWNYSKSGTEFFSGGSDGQILWWDTRKLTDPIDSLLMDPERTDQQCRARSFGVSVLEYETTIPTRFMAGTEMGMLFSCNRKGKTPTEKVQMRMNCHLGPIYAVTRNPAFVKTFLTVGDWCARLWSEDCRESAIIWTKNTEAMLTDGAWSCTKASQFFIARMDGVLDTWDLLQQQNEPVLTVKVSDEPLLCVRTNELGKFVACGNQMGAAYLIEVSENMIMAAKNDKQLLTTMFERENRREKILEGKTRELKLLRAKAAHGAEQNDITMVNGRVNVQPFRQACQQAAEEYITAVEEERLRRIPGVKQPSVEPDASRDVDNGNSNSVTTTPSR